LRAIAVGNNQFVVGEYFGNLFAGDFDILPLILKGQRFAAT